MGTCRAHWMITAVTTTSAKKVAGWLAAVREMTPATPMEIEAKRAAKRANWSE